MNEMQPKYEPIRKVSIICAKGSLEDVYAALIMANGAVMEGIEANLFFTFWGMDAITNKKMDKIKASTVGNPSLPMPSLLGIIPGMSWFMSKMMYRKMDKLDIPPVREFLELFEAGNGKVYGCKAAAEMFGIEESDLWNGCEGIITVGKFYEISAGAKIVFT